MAIGHRDTLSLVMLTGWDATELQNFKLQDGSSFAAVAADLNMALGALNAELINDPLWANLISITNQPDHEYRVGVSNGMGRFTEYGRGDAQRADTEGHMFPLRDWDRILGWTWKYLKEARVSQLEADIADGIKDIRDRWRLNILTRLLKRGDDSGAGYNLGTGGYSPGFATTAGSTSVDFTPPAQGGTSFSSTHEHYVGIAGGVFTGAVFTDAKSELREHGHEPTYEFIIGPSDETVVRALDDFTEVAETLVDYGSLQDKASLNAAANGFSGYYIGTISDFAVKVVPGIPQYYGFGWKSYGPRSQRNPLKIRVPKGASLPQAVAMTDPRSGQGGMYPLQDIMLYLEFGVGVADRTNGTARYVNNNTWADGTAT